MPTLWFQAFSIAMSNMHADILVHSKLSPSQVQAGFHV
jgi:hypothetical protein